MNPQYPQLKQAIFTVGDEHQFHEHAIFQSKEMIDTFRYLFYKHKKAVYIASDGEKLHFLPFSNIHYMNEFHSRLHPSTQCLSFRPLCQWYANNGLVRYEYPFKESDSTLPILQDMFQSLHQMFPMSYSTFLNRRDFPLIAKRKTCRHEPYFHIYGFDFPLVSHNYDDMTPLLSMVSCPGFEDIAIPTWEDWALFSGKEFPQVRTKDIFFQKKPWKQRMNKMVFRGRSTGLGVTAYTNPRLRLAEFKNDFFDVGITAHNLRPRINPETLRIHTIHPDDHPPLVSDLSYEKQCEYRYIIHVPGHSAAFRLASDLYSEAVVFIVDSPYRLWIQSFLIPYQHYIPIASDLSNLEDQVQYCLENEDRMLQIIKNTKELCQEHLSVTGILRYLASTIQKCCLTHNKQFYSIRPPLSLCTYPNLCWTSYIPNQVFTWEYAINQISHLWSFVQSFVQTQQLWNHGSLVPSTAFFNGTNWILIPPLHHTEFIDPLFDFYSYTLAAFYLCLKSKTGLDKKQLHIIFEFVSQFTIFSPVWKVSELKLLLEPTAHPTWFWHQRFRLPKTIIQLPFLTKKS